MKNCFLLILIFLANGIAHACSCAGGAGRACEEAWKPYTQAVFLGKVKSIHSGFWSLFFGEKMPQNSVEIEIEEAYLGISGKRVTVRTAMDGPACGYHFVEGERYVVFASKTPIGLHVSLCSHTRPLKEAAEDVAYLRSLPSLPQTGLIDGTYWRYTHDPNFKPKTQIAPSERHQPFEQYYQAMVPVPGAPVVVRSKDGTEHKTTVNQDGNWQIDGLRPGDYAIHAPVEDRMFVRYFKDEVTVAEKGCAQVDLRIELNGRIMGRLNHIPAQSDWIMLSVLAIPAETRDIYKAAAEARLQPVETEFRLAPLPEGKYVLAAYLSKSVAVGPGVTRIQSTVPTFFPGVKEPEKATVITVGPAQKITNKDFQLLDLELKK